MMNNVNFGGNNFSNYGQQRQMQDPDAYAQKYADDNNISLEEAKATLKEKYGDPAQQSQASGNQQAPGLFNQNTSEDSYLDLGSSFITLGSDIQGISFLQPQQQQGPSMFGGQQQGPQGGQQQQGMSSQGSIQQIFSMIMMLFSQIMGGNSQSSMQGPSMGGQQQGMQGSQGQGINPFGSMGGQQQGPQGLSSGFGYLGRLNNTDDITSNNNFRNDSANNDKEKRDPEEYLKRYAKENNISEDEAREILKAQGEPEKK